MTTTTTPRIYVASLSDYNAGRLHGRWIDADQTPGEIQSDVSEMLKASPEPVAEEWAIHDFEGFGSLSLSEWESLEKVSEWAAALAEHGDAYAAYVSYEGSDYATPEGFEDDYRGEWDSEEAYTEDLIDGIGLLDAMPEELRGYFDVAKYARDLFIDDCYSVDSGSGSVYVFARG